MTRLLRLPDKGSAAYQRLVTRRPISADSQQTVRAILEQVRSGGDRALLQLTEQFDGVRLARTAVPMEQCEAALAKLDPELSEALHEMARRIEVVHRAQQLREPVLDVAPGIRVSRTWRPFARVGLYAPGGRTVYPSSVLMLAIPARLAGCAEIVLCSPPQEDGRIARAILAAAAIAGVTEVHAAGGAQAIAALAYGTESMRRVDMIAGPGNAYVTAAKLAVFGEVAIDMPAGPSELVIVSDGSTDPDWLAADLRAQVEHSPDARSILLTTSTSDEQAITGLDDQRVSGYVVDSVEQAIAFANDYAPEHLMLACGNAGEYVARTRNAGSVFVGAYAAAAAGDYATGANHVLPTGGAARSFGALGLDSFGRFIQVQEIDKTALPALRQVSDVLARAERLEWHGASITRRSQPQPPERQVR